ncbi:MAG: EpsG family protein [Clostridiales bacterium]|nr:EpsG family protein [Clostridiales bacterium]
MTSQYVLILFWVGLIALISPGRNNRYEMICGEEKYRFSWLYAFIAFFPVIWMAGTRRYIADTSYYITSYLNMPSSLSDIPEYLLHNTKDKGFSALSIMIKSLVGQDFVPYLMILAIFQGISLVTFFRKYSDDLVFSLFLFVASSDYFAWMFNGLRQFLAVTVILFAVPWMLNKKYVPAFLTVLLASTFHQSALLMIPIIIIAQGKAWNKRTLIFIAGILLAITSLSTFTNVLDDALTNTQYVNVVTDYTTSGDDGTNPLRVLLYSIPAILSFFGRNKIKQEGILINFCTNMCIISSGLYLLSMVTSGIFLGRLPIYCSLFGYILLPWELENMFTYESSKILKTFAVLGYLVFYFLQMRYVYGVI